MDVKSGGSFLFHQSGLDFVSGYCDICKQRNVKVTAFHCKNHYYCRSCLEFAPKFCKKRDFSCPSCSRQSKRRNTGRLNEVDKFMRSQTDSRPSNGFEEVVFSVGGSSFVSWNNDPSSDDESDLTGNNEEWDKLLETMSRDKPIQTTSGSERKRINSLYPKSEQMEGGLSQSKFSSQPGIMGMAPATSFLQLKPSSDKYSSTSSGSSSYATTSNNSETSSMEIPNKSSSILLKSSHKNKTSKSASSVSSGSVSKSSDNDDGERLEVKGSATVAARYPKHPRWRMDASPDQYPDERRKRPNTPVSSRTSSSPDCQTRMGSGTSFECWMEELGRIEGPSYRDNEPSFSSHEKLPELEKDEFWDM